jgi:hypothetical protein
MSGPVIVTLRSSPPGLIIHTLVADSEKILDPPHCLHWFLRRLFSYMLAPRNSLHYPQFQLSIVCIARCEIKRGGHHLAQHSGSHNKTIYPKKKKVLQYTFVLSPINNIIGECRKNAPIEPSSGSGHPLHLLFEAVYSKRRDYCASIARSEALISITRPSA